MVQICWSLKHSTTKFLVEFQCYFVVFVTTKLASFYKGVTSIQLYRTSQKIRRCKKRMGWSDRGLLTLLTVITDKKAILSALQIFFLMNVLCLHLNLKCVSGMRQSSQSELRSVTVEWPCDVAIKTKCNDLNKSSFKSCCY